MDGHALHIPLLDDDCCTAESPLAATNSNQDTATVLQHVREIEDLVNAMLASWHDSPSILHARKWHRVAFREPLALTPLNPHTFDAEGGPCLVQGRDLSCGGLSFAHTNPMPYRVVAITFPSRSQNCQSIVTRLTWCRFCQDHTSLSGGKFLRRTVLDFECGIDWTRLPAA